MASVWLASGRPRSRRDGHCGGAGRAGRAREQGGAVAVVGEGEPGRAGPRSRRWPGWATPVAVTANDPAWPKVKYAVAALVMVGALGATTVMVSASVAVLPELLVAQMVTG